jgi:hypothetical protein
MRLVRAILQRRIRPRHRHSPLQYVSPSWSKTRRVPAAPWQRLLIQSRPGPCREVLLIVPPRCVKVASGNLSRDCLPHIEPGILLDFPRDKNLRDGLALVAARKIKRSEDRVKTRAIRTAIMIAVAATALAFSSCASERYRNHDNYYGHGSAHQAHAYGVRNGYSDGYRKGQHEGRENDPGDISVRALEQATHGYRSWMGPIVSFQDGYREGYHRGFREGYEATNRRWRDRDYDGYYRY